MTDEKVYRTLLKPSKARSSFCVGLLLCAAATFAAGQRNDCDMTPDGSVWITVARLSWAEEKFHRLHGRYGELAQMTNLFDGLPSDVTAGRMGSYVITIKLTRNGYILRANPEFRHGGRYASVIPEVFHTVKPRATAIPGYMASRARG